MRRQVRSFAIIDLVGWSHYMYTMGISLKILLAKVEAELCTWPGSYQQDIHWVRYLEID